MFHDSLLVPLAIAFLSSSHMVGLKLYFCFIYYFTILPHRDIHGHVNMHIHVHNNLHVLSLPLPFPNKMLSYFLIFCLFISHFISWTLPEWGLGTIYSSKDSLPVAISLTNMTPLTHSHYLSMDLSELRGLMSSSSVMECQGVIFCRYSVGTYFCCEFMGAKTIPHPEDNISQQNNFKTLKKYKLEKILNVGKSLQALQLPESILWKCWCLQMKSVKSIISVKFL